MNCTNRLFKWNLDSQLNEKNHISFNSFVLMYVKSLVSKKMSFFPGQNAINKKFLFFSFFLYRLNIKLLKWYISFECAIEQDCQQIVHTEVHTLSSNAS